MKKICPILKAGAMLSCLSSTSSFPVRGEINAHLTTSHDSYMCMGKLCAWYENGCPAYPREKGSTEPNSKITIIPFDVEGIPDMPDDVESLLPLERLFIGWPNWDGAWLRKKLCQLKGSFRRRP